VLLVRQVLFFITVLLIASHAFAHGGGLNKEGCHNNNETKKYHCHRPTSGNGEQTSLTKEIQSESYFNDSLALKLRGQREVRLYYTVPNLAKRVYVIVDIVTEKYVIEGGLDKRSSLDSIQQAIFASGITSKKPMIAIYDTDGVWGNIENQIHTVAQKLNVEFLWISKGQIYEK
jgi:hypothetical protein